ncbi:MAG: ribose-phosphate diphosphokinase [Gemmatimonadetes bacterium]|jgi:ribose-phosphate pyrophosphokinase|nr:ribose-phosphate diphosphokinase [Gemmatimonadota bacterium]MBT7859215.1 ribose-phosphate diphosphokinase [Gemmatimonadota bacterium]
MDLKVFTGNSNRPLAQGICQALGQEPGAMQYLQFSNENIKVKIEENVRGSDVFFIQTSCPPVNDHLMELLIALDALKYASAGRITAVLPYYPYGLADSKDEPRISVAGRLMADLITEAGADRILTMTLHSPQIMGFCRIPVDQLSGVPTICDHFGRQLDLDGAVAAAPDISRAKVTEAYAKRLGLPLVVIDNRESSEGDVRVHGVIGDVDGRDVIIFDDEIITGARALTGVEALLEHGARSVHTGCVHGTLSGDAREKVASSPMASLAVTDTVPQPAGASKVTVCTVADHFAHAIQAIYQETSISTLFT